MEIILEDLKIKWDGLMRLYCDNRSAINIAHNLVQHHRTKYILVNILSKKNLTVCCFALDMCLLNDNLQTNSPKD